jgi:hypothetical protein
MIAPQSEWWRGPPLLSRRVIPALSRDPPSLQHERGKTEILGKIAPARVRRVDKIVLPCAGVQAGKRNAVAEQRLSEQRGGGG